jgi:hypothetical protein
MEIEELKGLVIFIGIVGAYTFVLLGCLERRLKKVAAVIDDAKYVN